MHSRIVKDPQYFEVIGKTCPVYSLVTVFAGWSCWFCNFASVFLIKLEYHDQTV